MSELTELERAVLTASATFYEYWVGEETDMEKVQEYSHAWLKAMEDWTAARAAQGRAE